MDLTSTLCNVRVLGMFSFLEIMNIVGFLVFFVYMDPPSLLLQIRNYRVLGFSFLETCLTGELIAIIVVLRKSDLREILNIVVFFLLLTIFVHMVFGVNTQLNYMLGLCKCPPNLDSLSGIFTC